MYFSRFLTSYTHLQLRLPAAQPTRLITSSTRHTHKPSTFQFHGLGTRSYSFRRAGGVRGLISKRGLGLNSASGLPHIPRRSTIPPKNIIRAGGGSLLGAFSTTAAVAAGPDTAADTSTDTSTHTAMSYPVQKTEEEWRAVLSAEQFRILRNKGTEPARSGEYDTHHPEAGTYTCAACAAPLYTAVTKFKSGCGWPAFYESLPGKVVRRPDTAFGLTRTEIVCASCGGHLGHVFKGEGYPTPTDERHCVNSISLKFVDKEEGEQKTSKA